MAILKRVEPDKRPRYTLELSFDEALVVMTVLGKTHYKTSDKYDIRAYNEAADHLYDLLSDDPDLERASEEAPIKEWLELNL